MLAQGGEPTGRRLAPPLILLLLILLGFALRAHSLDAFSFWTDEGLTPERSGYPIAQILRNDILIQGVVTKDTHPPFYYLIIHLTQQLFGASDFAFRYPSVLFGVLLIPLLYQLGRRMSGIAVGLVAALLLTANPLHVYYGQEARMYSLLALLVTGMGYVLWRAISRNTKYEVRDMSRESGASFVSRISYLASSLGGRLLLYGVLAALAVYTHYTVAFLVAVQAPFWAWVLWRAGLRRLIAGAAVLGVLVAVPLVPYTIPRLLAGAEANYYHVSPLTMLLDVVRFFNLGLTVDFSQTFIVALNLLALGLLLLGVWGSARMTNEEQAQDSYLVSRISYLSRPIFLLSWLLAVVFGLMAGSILFKPMYQGVRHIMAGSPAFLLLVAFGVWALMGMPTAGEVTPVVRPPQEANARTRRHKDAGYSTAAGRHLPLAAGLLALVLILAGSTVALLNLYTNPAYVKDDFRAIVRFIEARAGARDAIVYNNAVLLPLHEHYRQRDDIAVTALPTYPQYATGAEPELAALARDHDRVWFVTDPPADGRDESELIRGWLDTNLTAVVNRLFPARTTEARVIAYSTGHGAPPLEAPGSGEVGELGSEERPCSPAPRHPCPLSQLPQLTGVAFDSPLATPTLWVDLVWQGARPETNASLLFTLTGPDGVEYHREARALLPDEDTRWDETAANRLSYNLPLPPGLPPGTYTLTLTPEGNDPLVLGPVEIAPTSEWPVAPEALFEDVPGNPNTRDEIRNTDGESLVSRISHLVSRLGGRRSAVDWPTGLSLAAVVPWDDAVLPGNNLPLTLYWRVGPEGADLSDLRYRLEVIDGEGNVLRAQEARPGAPWLRQVAPGALLREVTALYFRPETEPGRYWLRWTLLDGDDPVGEPVTSGRVVVEPWPLETDVPAAPYVVEADFGPDIRLRSYYVGVPTDGLLNLALYWQARREPEGDYVVFVHLADEAGAIVSQVDAIPTGGTRPTSGWRAGEVITDIHNLPIPADLPPGTYHVNVGLYDPDDGARPAVIVAGAPQPDNQLRLVPTFDLPWGEP